MKETEAYIIVIIGLFNEVSKIDWFNSREDRVCLLQLY